MDYADSDYRQLYNYGPMNYKQASAEARQSKENNNSSGDGVSTRPKESEML